MIAIALIHLCFGGDSPLSYVKKSLANVCFFWSQPPYSAKQTTIE